MKEVILGDYCTNYFKGDGRGKCVPDCQWYEPTHANGHTCPFRVSRLHCDLEEEGDEDQNEDQNNG